ncbi:MAG: hypothetical protein IH627_02230 [Rubrivivax sp.]|nr:hypothetical protein [Rubrivivax sp.]
MTVTWQADADRTRWTADARAEGLERQHRVGRDVERPLGGGKFERLLTASSGRSPVKKLVTSTAGFQVQQT